MKIATVAVAYNEARFIKPHLDHIPDWVDKRLVLVSTEPWQGEPEPDDGTAQIARDCGAIVIEHDWGNETDQRNAAQEYLYDFDWVIILDPDEFLDKKGWENLWNLLTYTNQEAFVCERQRVFWKDKEVSPHTDYQQIILVKPNVRFIENRVINTNYGISPVILFHFSWARTDKEVKSKLSHYSHANEFDWLTWYNEVWLDDTRTTNLHPKTPETLKGLIKAKLPKELQDLNLWPR